VFRDLVGKGSLSARCLSRRTFLGGYRPYKIAHFSSRRRAFLNVVGAQGVAQSLL
jgi:hypothetical protein